MGNSLEIKERCLGKRKPSQIKDKGCCEPGKNYPLFKVLLVGDHGVGKSSLALSYVDKISLEKCNIHGNVQRCCNENVQGTSVNMKILEWNDNCFKPNHPCYRSINGVLLVFDISNRESFKNCSKWLAEIDKFAEESVQVVIVANKCDYGFARVDERGVVSPPQWLMCWPSNSLNDQNSALCHSDQLSVVVKYLDFQSCLNLRLTCKLTFNLMNDRMELVRRSFIQPQKGTCQYVTRDEVQSFCDEVNVPYLATSAKSGQGVSNVFNELASRMVDKHKSF